MFSRFACRLFTQQARRYSSKYGEEVILEDAIKRNVDPSVIRAELTRVRFDSNLYTRIDLPPEPINSPKKKIVLEADQVDGFFEALNTHNEYYGRGGKGGGSFGY